MGQNFHKKTFFPEKKILYKGFHSEKLSVFLSRVATIILNQIPQMLICCQTKSPLGRNPRVKNFVGLVSNGGTLSVSVPRLRLPVERLAITPIIPIRADYRP